MKWLSPYREDGVWLRGNFHTHTTVSDGGYDPEEAVFYYRDCTHCKRGPWSQYRFIAITDHTTNAKKELFHMPASTEEFSVIEGREDSFGHHILGIGCPMTFQEDEIGKGRACYELEEDQRVIDKIVRQGGIAILAHPHWAEEEYWPKWKCEQLNNYTAIEIINGDLFSGPGHLSTDVWDAALTAGKKVWATGNDDFHSVRDYHNAWNMVYAKENTPEAIMEALRQGSLYVSNGAAFDSIIADGDWIIATCSKDSIYNNTEKTFRFIGEGGHLYQLQMGKNGTAAYKAQGCEKYIRVELSLDWGMAAFSQPFFPAED